MTEESREKKARKNLPNKTVSRTSPLKFVHVSKGGIDRFGPACDLAFFFSGVGESNCQS